MLRKVVGQWVVTGEVCGNDEQGFWIHWWTSPSHDAGSPRVWDDPLFTRFRSCLEAQAFAVDVLEKIERVEPSGRPVIPLV